MDRFIRLDMKGHWKGTEHQSSILGIGDETGDWEQGVSCYPLDDDDKGYALAELRDYWDNIASLHDIEDYEDMQVTIFQGEYITDGSDAENIATCERTISEKDAIPLMKQVFEAYEDYFYGDIEEHEYHERLEKIEL
ncbi:hypothetical protein [Tuberibacillus sp. Marseille-P3662]|uniref:hypothetical protein n=1 Tax=Tuberibacillus sp. Marseille-P3662 TaxID=1965358 RepID=UPI000A1C8C31|nr:hypothetical protein [Tuberibacillus sp. Marseille-P3662]